MFFSIKPLKVKLLAGEQKATEPIQRVIQEGEQEHDFSMAMVLTCQCPKCHDTFQGNQLGTRDMGGTRNYGRIPPFDAT